MHYLTFLWATWSSPLAPNPMAPNWNEKKVIVLEPIGIFKIFREQSIQSAQSSIRFWFMMPHVFFFMMSLTQDSAGLFICLHPVLVEHKHAKQMGNFMATYGIVNPSLFLCQTIKINLLPKTKKGDFLVISEQRREIVVFSAEK